MDLDTIWFHLFTYSVWPLFLRHHVKHQFYLFIFLELWLCLGESFSIRVGIFHMWCERLALWCYGEQQAIQLIFKTLGSYFNLSSSRSPLCLFIMLWEFVRSDFQKAWGCYSIDAQCPVENTFKFTNLFIESVQIGAHPALLHHTATPCALAFYLPFT